MKEIIDEIRRYHSLKMISDDEITPYIELALLELPSYGVTPNLTLKATAFLTLSLLGAKLWIKIQQRANEYDESLETFKDLEVWQSYWKNRLYSLTKADDDKNNDIKGFNYAAI